MDRHYRIDSFPLGSHFIRCPTAVSYSAIFCNVGTSHVRKSSASYTMHMNAAEETKPEADQFPLHWILLAATLIAIFVSLYIYLFGQRYDFLIEAPCNVATQECYVRDCSEGDCPPNELSSYRVFIVPAATFDSCTDNSCANVCSPDNSPCTEVMCSAQEDVQCLGPLAPQGPSL